MKHTTSFAVASLALLCCAGCSTVSNVARSAGNNALPFVTGAAIAYLGGKDAVPYRTNSPNVPKRLPNIATAEGGQVWLDKNHRPEYIRMLSGDVFEFSYDKHGQLQKVIEPSGTRLTRNATSDWTRHGAEGKKTSFFGTVAIGTNYQVRYTAKDGSQIVHNPNGYITELEKFQGHDRLVKASDPRGRVTEFSYDTDGKPLSIKTSDGFILAYADGDKWYRVYPGTTFDTAVPYRVTTDPASGSVTIATPSGSTTYGCGGMTTLTQAEDRHAG